MGKVRSIKFNFIMNTILTVSAMLFPLITYPYVTRVLGASGVGKVNFANGNIAYFAMIAQLGIPTYGIRACAQVRNDEDKLNATVQEILIINMIMCGIAYAAFIACVFAIPQYRREKELFFVMGFTMLFNTIGVEWLYKGIEQYGYITVRSIIFKAMALVATFLLVRAKSDYIIYGGIVIFATVGSNVMNIIVLKRHVSLRRVEKYDFKRHLKPIFIFFSMSVATTIYTNMDSVMIGFMRGTSENGIYDTAVKAKGVLVALTTSLGTVLMPRVSYYIKNGQNEEFTRILKKAVNFVILLSVPLCLYFMLFARQTVSILGGAEFYESAVPMRIIMPTLIFIGLSNIFGLQMLVPLGRERDVLYSEIVGAIVNLIINTALIPSLGASGAAIGTVAAEFAVLAYQIWVVRDRAREPLMAVSYAKLLIALAAAVVASVWVLFTGMGDLTALAVSCVLFFAAYVIALLIAKEKLTCELLRQAIAKVRRG